MKKKVKVRLNIRLFKETKDKLEMMSENLGISETAIIELALRKWFIKWNSNEGRQTSITI